MNRPSGPVFGRTAAGKTPKSTRRQAVGRPEARFRCFPGSSPAKLRPGRTIYGPDAPLRNTEYTLGAPKPETFDNTCTKFATVGFRTHDAHTQTRNNKHLLYVTQ